VKFEVLQPAENKKFKEVRIKVQKISGVLLSGDT